MWSGKATAGKCDDDGRGVDGGRRAAGLAGVAWLARD